MNFETASRVLRRKKRGVASVRADRAKLVLRAEGGVSYGGNQGDGRQLARSLCAPAVRAVRTGSAPGFEFARRRESITLDGRHGGRAGLGLAA
jgi:hypothetical protein